VQAVSLLQTGSTLLLNLGFTWLLGSLLARRWLRAAGASEGATTGLRQLDVVAAGLAALASAGVMWADTAIMGGVALDEVGDMLWMMLFTTDHGHASCVLLIAMLAMAVVRIAAVAQRGGESLAALLLFAFALVRASMGHAGEGGYWTMTMAAEAVHFIAIGVWTGAVLVSGWFVLGGSSVRALTLPRAARYLDAMSRAAMAAVIAIVVTGIYSGWHRVGSADNLAHTQYGYTLLAKVALVVGAIGLGGYNKYVGLPAAARSLPGLWIVRNVLRIETILLMGALLAAALLTGQQPPTAA
jgi:putative copper resistance protein D